MNDLSVLVTGANGFIGRTLCETMRIRGIGFLPVVRRRVSSDFVSAAVKDIGPSTDWRAELRNIGAVVHLAARVHAVHDSSLNPLREYRFANVESTLNLAAQCAAAGVRRFVYISSVKVNGESTREYPFSELDLPAPADPYGISKYEAEVGLQRLSRETGLEVVVIRPPLVYGSKVKANFLQLMQWVNRGVPLPLASIDNRRSLIFVENLVDVILRCIKHSEAPGHTFLVSDGHDVSIAELIRAVASAMDRQAMIFPLPPVLLRMSAILTGKKSVADRLLNSLQVDIGCAKRVLGWFPPYSFETGIDRTVRDFIETYRASEKHGAQTIV